MPSLKQKIAVVIVAIVGVPVAAFAQTPATAARKSLPEVVSSLSAKGYTIREIEMDDGHFEASVIDPKNIRGELKIDGMTGEIIRFKPED